VVCSVGQKLDVLYSFVKSHLKSKVIVFFASCNQVKFVTSIMKGLQPGVSVMGIHGKIKQERRTRIYFDFLRRTNGAVLLATDVAARGLDFPGVEWVVQMDCPEDSDMYLHRVGRTARNGAAGKGLLVLLPSEERGMKEALLGKKIEVKRLNINPSRTVTVSKRCASVVAADADVNEMAKKAFKAYVKSVHLMPNKDVFKGKELDLKGYTKSLGLATCPSLRFLKEVKDGEEGREENRERKNKSRKLAKLKMQIREEKMKKRIERMGGGGKWR
jgi:ATP-dependent RNA helicase DDX10/DBP4